MSYLDGVPFRTARSLEGAAVGQGGLVSAPAIDVPDCAELLVSTMPDFSLERKVLYWLEAASLQQTCRHGATSDVVPTAPPCWLLLVDPRDGYGAAAESKEAAARRPLGRAWLHQARPKTSPGLLEPTLESGCRNAASPDPARQRRSMVIFNNMKNELEGARRKLAALVHPLNRAYAEKKQAFTLPSLHQHPRSNRNFKYRSATACPGPLTPAPPRAPASMPPIRQHKPTVASLSPYACLPPASAPARPLASHRAHPDSAADLLAALSQEERDLIEPVIALGYPARKAILTLQKTGKQSLSQVGG
ncbi:UBA1L protein, partial [Crypturellus undulatus]|nr:UBA1L protein [Crypturellus undulatus]